ncbi:N-acetylmuramate alpha-1-phosphate uridylyltransferase MurU [Larsenimonas rhizosphaerae]|uniref:N-acetylmuramate alpha-1-phosphate uridylyltransferase MurU n=1 Tax=Larsenimonas rhizosphaerae TaxID=2944682 RepID=UPI002033E1D0|nr:nucleotidyltransferase family protein [Larsenimonas rhizosphaerae]MCM2130177.1 nucleotidyltransferase family protein [Larsenimonas rhizosphaerae]
MKAMILAAGLGTRMRPLTDTCPKPLLPAGGKPLLVHHLERLRDSGITDIVINVSYRRAQVMDALGDGSALGVSITWSEEETPLETAGGIRHALPLLGDAPFWLINGDVWCDADLTPRHLADQALGHLLMVDNPPHHPDGDFRLKEGQLDATGTPRLTYSGLAILDPALFHTLPDNTPARLAPLLVIAMEQHRVTGEHFTGQWVDVGTPERLHALDAQLS